MTLFVVSHDAVRILLYFAFYVLWKWLTACFTVIFICCRCHRSHERAYVKVLCLVSCMSLFTLCEECFDHVSLCSCQIVCNHIIKQSVCMCIFILDFFLLKCWLYFLFDNKFHLLYVCMYLNSRERVLCCILPNPMHKLFWHVWRVFFIFHESPLSCEILLCA